MPLAYLQARELMCPLCAGAQEARTMATAAVVLRVVRLLLVVAQLPAATDMLNKEFSGNSSSLLRQICLRSWDMSHISSSLSW